MSPSVGAGGCGRCRFIEQCCNLRQFEFWLHFLLPFFDIWTLPLLGRAVTSVRGFVNNFLKVPPPSHQSPPPNPWPPTSSPLSSFLTDQTAAVVWFFIARCRAAFFGQKRKREEDYGMATETAQVLKEPWCNITSPSSLSLLLGNATTSSRCRSTPCPAAGRPWRKKLTGGQRQAERGY